MSLIKKVSFLTMACLLCFTLFSFKKMDTTEKQLSNLENFNQMQIYSNSDQSDKEAVSGRVKAVVRAAKAVGESAVKAWQKSSREVVYATVALWPLTRSIDDLIGLKIDNRHIQESKLAKL